MFRNLRDDKECLYFYFYFFVKAELWCWLEPGCAGLQVPMGTWGTGNGPCSETFAFLFWSSSTKAGQEPSGTKSEPQRLSCPWPVCLREQALGLAALHMASVHARTPTLPCPESQHHPGSPTLVCSELTRSLPGPVASLVWP